MNSLRRVKAAETALDCNYEQRWSWTRIQNQLRRERQARIAPFKHRPMSESEGIKAEIS